MKEPEVVREDRARQIYKAPWHDPMLPVGSLLPPMHYHDAIGVVVVRYNVLELYFRHLVGLASGLKSNRVDALLLHVNATTLEQSLRAVALDTIDCLTVRDELLFSIEIFRRCRENRNFLVHTAYELYPFALSMDGPRMLLTKRTARGKKKIEHYRLAVETIRRVADEIHDAHAYFATVMGPVSKFSGGGSITLPIRPPLPVELSSESPKIDRDAELLARVAKL